MELYMNTLFQPFYTFLKDSKPWLLSLFFLGLSLFAAAQNIVVYDFDTNDSPSSADANASGSVFSVSSALTGSVTSNTFETDQWGSTGAIDLGDYVEFTAIPDVGYEMDLTELKFDEFIEATGVADWAVRSSIDNYATNIQTGTTHGTIGTNTVTLGGATYSNLSEPVTFRIYGYTAGSANKKWTFDNVTLVGTTNALPLIALYNFDGTPGSGTVNSEHANVTAGTFTAAGTLNLNNDDNNTDIFSYDNWADNGAATISLAHYYEFTITPDAGYSMTFTDLTFLEEREHADMPLTWEIRSDLDSYATTIATGSTTDGGGTMTRHTVDLTGGTFDNLSSAITFRIYAYNISNYNTNREWDVDDVFISGTAADVTDPVFSSTAPSSNAFVNDTKVSYTLSETIASGTITWTRTGGSADAMSPHVQALTGTELNSGAHTDITLTNDPTLVDGAEYSISFDGTDASANSATTVTNTVITYDVSAPTNQNTVFASSVEHQGGAAVTIVSSGDATNEVWFAPTGTSSFSASSTMTTAASGTATSILAPTDEGTYYIYVIDAAGNVSSHSTAALIVDNTDPVISSTAPATNAFVNDTKVSYTITEANTIASGTITWTRTGGSTDGGSPHVQALTGSELNSGAHTDITLTNDPTLVDGAEYSVAFDITDEAGNTATTVTNTTVTYDVSPPTNQNTVFAASVEQQGGTSVTIVSSGDANNEVWFAPTGTSSFSAGSTMTQAASGTATSINAPSDEGTYYIYVIDQAGNVSSQSTATLTVDNTDPVISNTAPTSSSSVNDTQVSYTITETNTIASGSVTWTRTGGAADGGSPHVQALTGAELNAGAHNNITLTNDPTLVDGAIYSIAFNVTDEAGNTATTITNTSITYDVSDPVFSSTAPASNAFVNNTQVNYTLSETITSGTITWTRTGGSADGGSPHVQVLNGSELTFGPHNNTTLTNDPTLVDGAEYTISFDGTDAAGNTASTVSNTTVTYDVSAPTNQNTVFPTSVTQQGGSTVTIVSSGDANNEVWFAPNATSSFSAGATMTMAGGTATSIAAPANEGTYYIYVIDQAGNVSSQSTATLTVDNTDPEVTSIVRSAPTAQKTNATSVTFRVTFNEPVTNVDLTDFAKAGTANGTLSGINPVSTSIYDVTMNTISGDGNLNLDFAAHNITDIAGNNFGGTINSEQEYTIDNTKPQATVTTESGPIYTGDDNIVVTVNYNEDMDTGGADPIISFTTSTHFTSDGDGMWASGTSWTETFTHDLTAEEIASEIAIVTAGGATDVAGNSDLGDTSPGFLIDTQRPTITFAGLNLINGSKDYVEITFSETINLTNAATVDYVDDGGGVGFDIDDGGDDNAVTSGVYATSGNMVTLEGTSSSKWGVTTSVLTYYSGGNIYDVNGNEMANNESRPLDNGNTTPPVLSPNTMTLYPDGENNDQIVFTLDEGLDTSILTNGNEVDGFSTDVGTVSTAIYNPTGNVITLTSSNPYEWTTGVPPNSTVTVSYDQGTGNALNLGGVELGTITNHAVVYENVAPAITALTVASDNTNSTWAKGGDQITVAFTVDDGVKYSSINFTNVQSGGVGILNSVPTVSPMTDVHSYSAVFDIDVNDTNGAFTFDLTFTDEAGNTVTGTPIDETDITTGTTVTVDNTKPGTPSTPDLNNSDDSFSPFAYQGTNTDNVTNVQTPRIEDGTTNPENNSTVTVYCSTHGDVVLGTGSADGSGDFSISTSSLSHGTHAIYITATDAAGNEGLGSSTLAVTIDIIAPDIDYIELKTAHSGHDHLDVYFTEELDLQHGTNQATGFSVSDDSIDPQSEYYETGAPAYYVHLTSNNDAWSASTQVDYNSATGHLYDLAGNSVPSQSGLTATDSSPPTLGTGIVFLPNGSGPEQIVFNMSEELNRAEGSNIKGFFVNGVEVGNGFGNATYSSKGVANTITLESDANGDWDQNVVITYDDAFGNVADLFAQPMVDIAPGEEILINNLTIRSNNSTNPSSHAKEGDKIFLEFDATSLLSTTPVVTIDGDAAVVSAEPTLYDYIYEITTDASTTEAVLTFTIDVQQAGDIYTTVTATTDDPTSPSSITYDRTAPVVSPRTIVSDNAVDPNQYAIINDVITLSFTSNETLNATPTVSVDGLSVVPTNLGLNYTAQQTVSASNTETGSALPISISVTDLAGNTTVHTTTSDGSELTIDKTIPTINSITLQSTDPHDAGTGGNLAIFRVTFSEPVIAVDITDFNAILSNVTGGDATAVSASSGTTLDVTVSGHDLNDNAASGTMGLLLDLAGILTDNAGNEIVSSAVSGSNESYTVINPEPNAPTGLSASNPQTTTIDLSWTNSAVPQIAYQNVILVMEQSFGPLPNPADGTFLADDLSLTTGTSGQMVINVPHGQSSYTVTGLNSGKNYNFEIYAYTNDGTLVNYNTTGSSTSSSTNTAAETRIVYSSSATTISSLSNTEVDADGNPASLVFTIQDDGANSSADNAKTLFSQIKLTQGPGNAIADWTTVIQGAKITDNDNNKVTGTVNMTDITFASIATTNEQLGEVDDDELKTYTVRVWLKSSLPDGVDNLDIEFVLDASVGTNFTLESGSSNINGSFNYVSSVDGNNAIDIDATELNFTTDVVDVGLYASFPSDLVVTAQDANGNRDVDYSGTVAVSVNGTLTTFANDPTAFPTGPTTGILTFPSNFYMTEEGTGQIIVTDVDLIAPSPTAATSSTFTTVKTTRTQITAVTNVGTFSSLRSNEFATVGVDPDAAGEIFDFTITDDVSAIATDNDALPTKITDLIITPAGANQIDFADAIQLAALVDDGGNTHFASAINSGGIVFNSIAASIPGDFGYIPDGTARTYDLYILLKGKDVAYGGDLANTIDNATFNFEIDESTITVDPNTSSKFESLTNQTSGNIGIEVVATELGFTTQPTTNQEFLVNKNFGTDIIIIEARDAYGTRDEDYNQDITVVDANGLVLKDPPTTFNLSGGEVTFSDDVTNGFQYTEISTALGTQLQITPNGGSFLTTLTSNTFIVRVGAETSVLAGSTSEPATIASSTIASPGTFVFDFKISDDDHDSDGTGGGGPEDDGNPTLISDIVITQGSTFNTILDNLGVADWTKVIAGARLIENGTPANFIDGTVSADRISFNGIPFTAGTLGYIADNASKTYDLHIWLLDMIDFRISGNMSGPATIFVDNKQLEFAINETDITVDADGSDFISTQLIESGDANAVDVDDTKIVFSVDFPPSGISLDTDLFAPFPQVEARDAQENVNIDFTEAVSDFTISDGSISITNNPDAGDLGLSFVAGIFNFNFSPAMQFADNGGENLSVTLKTSSYGSGVTSGLFDISADELSYISLVSTPGDILYLNSHESSNIDNTTTTSQEIARFLLVDGLVNGDPVQSDGAATTLDQLELTFDNTTYVRRIAIYDALGNEIAGTEQDATDVMTFSNLGITTPVHGSIEFSVRASFDDILVDKKAIDNSPLNVEITGAINGGGSKFLDPVAAGGASGTNLLEVVATQFTFDGDINSVQGAGIPLTYNTTEPQFTARDANGNIDLDYDYSTYTLTAADNTSISVAFGAVTPAIDGELLIENLNFTVPSNVSLTDGTITIEDVTNGVAAVSTTPIQVTHTFIEQLNDPRILDINGNVIDQGTGIASNDIELDAGALSLPILGFKLMPITTIGTDPVLDTLIVSFNGYDPSDANLDITPTLVVSDIFTNYVLLESTDNEIDEFRDNETAIPYNEIEIDDVNQRIIFKGINKLLERADDQDTTYIFLTADVKSSVNSQTPYVEPYITGTSGITDFIMLNGSSQIDGGILGLKYNFIDALPPVVDYFTPDGNQPGGLDADNTTDLVIAFDEDVLAYDGYLTLFDASDNSSQEVWFSDLTTQVDRDAYVVEVETNNNPRQGRDFTYTPDAILKDDNVYYVTIPKGTANNRTGFSDLADNFYEGITNSNTWFFKTRDTQPPKWVTSVGGVAGDPAIIDNVYDQGFGLYGRIDEDGIIYYVVLPNNATRPSPAQVKAGTDASDNASIPAAGSFSVTMPDQYFVKYIDGLSNLTNYDIYLVAEDGNGNLMRDDDTNDDIDDDTGGTEYLGEEVLFLEQQTAASGGSQAVVDFPSFYTPQICVGDFIEIPDIHIRESDNNDFTLSDGATLNLALPNGFEFITNQADPEYTASVDFRSGSDIQSIDLAYPTSTVVRLTFTYDGNNNAVDNFTIKRLKIKATTAGATGDLIRIGGTLVIDGLAEDATFGSYTASSTDQPTFAFDPNTSTFANNDPEADLIPSAEISFINTNIFSGNGVNGNEEDGYKFYPSIAGVGQHGITLNSTDEYGCLGTLTRTVTVFDATQAIPEITTPYMCVDPTNPNNTLTIQKNGKEFFRLEKLSIDTVGLTGTHAYIGTVDDPVLVQDGENWTFDINLAGKYSNEKVDSIITTLEFTAIYQYRFDASIRDTIPVQVYLSVPPSLTFGTNDSPLSGNNYDFCEDDVDIILSGDVNREVFFDRTETITMVNWNATDEVFEEVTDTGNSLSDNTAGTGTFDPAVAYAFGGDPSGLSYIFQYEVINQITACRNTDTLQVKINPKPDSYIGVFNKDALVGCVGVDVEFDNTSSSPQTTDVLTYQWNFDDANNAPGNNASSEEFPTHNYIENGNYSVTLITETDKGCISEVAEEIFSIGENPTAQFNFRHTVLGEDVLFTNTTPLNPDPASDIVELEWTFQENTTTSSNNTITANFNEDIAHEFLTPGIKEVKLTATTEKGCVHSDSVQLFIVPHYTIGAGENNAEDFENPQYSNGGWVAWADGKDQNTTNSWEIGSSSGTVVNEAGNNFWTTNTSGSHGTSEVSYVYSPLFNIADMERPMVEFKRFVNLDNTNGVVIEYSVDTLNGNSQNGVLGTWNLLGDREGGIESGINWYNQADILFVGGNQLTGSYGWTRSDDTSFKQAKHTLSEVLNEIRNNNLDGNVQFRFSFVSGTATPLDGFAFDNFRIGERTRTVLVENFTNSDSDPSGVTGSEIDYINSTFASSIENSVEVIIMNYYTDFPSPDAFNMLNPVAPSARTSFYNIDEVPYAIMDGLDELNESNQKFSEWGEEAFNKRTLQLAEYSISAQFDQPDERDNIQITIDAALNSADFDASIFNSGLLYAAIVAPDLEYDGQTGENVVRKMLPSAAGTYIPKSEMDNPEPIVLNWSPDNEQYVRTGEVLENMKLVVFLQDEVTKTIYQAEIFDLTNENLNTVTDADELITDKTFALYPNPAKDFSTVDFGKVITDDYDIKVFDQFGKLIFKDQVLAGQRSYQLDTKNYLNSLYLIQIENNGRVIQREKLIVLDK